MVLGQPHYHLIEGVVLERCWRYSNPNHILRGPHPTIPATARWTLSLDSFSTAISPSPVHRRGHKTNLQPSPSLLQSDSALSHLLLGRSRFTHHSWLTSCSQDSNKLGLRRHGALRIRRHPCAGSSSQALSQAAGHARRPPTPSPESSLLSPPKVKVSPISPIPDPVLCQP